jgi:hypothetical protein
MRPARSACGQIALFAEAVEVEPPGRVLLVGVEDQPSERQPVPVSVVRFGRDLGIRYLAEGELRAAGVTPAFWISDPPPGALDRRAILETISNQVIEQDDAGRIWIDDEPLAAGFLIAYGTPARDREGDLLLGEAAALLLARRDDHGWDLRLHITTAVIWIFDLPRLAPAPPLCGWMRLARKCQTKSEAVG